MSTLVDIRDDFREIQRSGVCIRARLVNRTPDAPPVPEWSRDGAAVVILGVNLASESDRHIELAGDAAAVHRLRGIAGRGARLLAAGGDLGKLADTLDGWHTLGAADALWWLLVGEAATDRRATWFETADGEVVAVAANAAMLAEIAARADTLDAPQVGFPRAWLTAPPGWWLAEFDAVDACVALCDAIVRETATADQPAGEGDWFPAAHFKTRYNLADDTLRAAARACRIRVDKRGGRNYYPHADVARLWPHCVKERE